MQGHSTSDVQRDYANPRRTQILDEEADLRLEDLIVEAPPVNGRSVEAVSMALVESARAGKDTVVIISADATAAHQSVITVMEAARRSGLTQITFATQSSAQAGGR